MRFISHRGNLNGAKPSEENTLPYIQEALKKGFEVEIDVWKIGKDFYLGHDEPKYYVPYTFLLFHMRKLWLHCKNREAFLELESIGGFQHNHESFVKVSTLFSTYYWHHSEYTRFLSNSICVMPELKGLLPGDYSKAAGVCSDFIGREKFIYELWADTSSNS